MKQRRKDRQDGCTEPQTSLLGTSLLRSSTLGLGGSALLRASRSEGREAHYVHKIKRDPPVFLECCPGSCQLLPFINLLQVSVLAEQLGDILRSVRCRSSSPAHASNLERILLALFFSIDNLENGCRSPWPSLRPPGGVLDVGSGKPRPDHPGPTHDDVHPTGIMHSRCNFGHR